VPCVLHTLSPLFGGTRTWGADGEGVSAALVVTGVTELDDLGVLLKDLFQAARNALADAQTEEVTIHSSPSPKENVVASYASPAARSLAHPAKLCTVIKQRKHDPARFCLPFARHIHFPLSQAINQLQNRIFYLIVSAIFPPLP